VTWPMMIKTVLSRVNVRLPWESIQLAAPYRIDSLVEREGLEPSTPAL
jgi:hypothetical protein